MLCNARMPVYTYSSPLKQSAVTAFLQLKTVNLVNSKECQH